VEDIQDIAGHLQGGIPMDDVAALGKYWEIFPQLKTALFQPNRANYLELAVPKDSIKTTIFNHPEFIAFSTVMAELFAEWRSRSTVMLKDLDIGCQPKILISKLAEDLLEHYVGKDSIADAAAREPEVPSGIERDKTDGKPFDRYDIYQHLLDYWAEVMQDDVYLIAADGWKAETYRVIESNKKGKEVDKGWACDLVPKELMVARYFVTEQTAIESQQADLESISAQIEELEEEHGGDEGAFSELEKVSKANITARIKEIKGDIEAKAEEKILREWLKLNDRQTALKKEIKDAEAQIDRLVYDRYPTLTEGEIKVLVVDDKWLARIGAAVAGEIDRVSQGLTQRVKVLAQRYEVPLPELASHVAELEARVAGHLARMGF
jgi:type I restriction enzyme M protein